MIVTHPPESSSIWTEFEYQGRPFVRGTVPRGDNQGLSFTIASRLAGRYEVKRFFASGGCGLIMQGRDLQTDTDVLIKTTLRYDVVYYAQGRDEDGFFQKVKQTRQQLQTERRIMVLLKNLGCNAIPNPNDYVFDWNPQLAGPYTTSDGRTWSYDDESMLSSEPYLVMEFVEGTPLTDKIGPGIDERRALAVMREVCYVLQVLQQSATRGRSVWKLIYQDLKPDNIIIGNQDATSLLDFGGCRLTVDGRIANQGAYTPGYCPPECDAGELTAAADSYTVGSTLYHILTGKSPATFLASELVGTGPKSVKYENWDWTHLKSRVSRETVWLIQRCLQSRHQDRPAGAAELSQELEALLKQL
ncbi:MAG: serine/threonine protein kinase [Planctomycetaceae bacterium]|nr:serine/threonine protein kinase [Planctomycetaceae bacterium]